MKKTKNQEINNKKIDISALCDIINYQQIDRKADPSMQEEVKDGEI